MVVCTSRKGGEWSVACAAPSRAQELRGRVLAGTQQHWASRHFNWIVEEHVQKLRNIVEHRLRHWCRHSLHLPWSVVLLPLIYFFFFWKAKQRLVERAHMQHSARICIMCKSWLWQCGNAGLAMQHFTNQVVYLRILEKGLSFFSADIFIQLICRSTALVNRTILSALCKLKQKVWQFSASSSFTVSGTYTELCFKYLFGVFFKLGLWGGILCLCFLMFLRCCPF